MGWFGRWPDKENTASWFVGPSSSRDTALRCHVWVALRATKSPLRQGIHHGYAYLSPRDTAERCHEEMFTPISILFGASLHHDGPHPVSLRGAHSAPFPDLHSRRMIADFQLDYIHQNPVKRGFVDEPEHWRWSRVRCHTGRACVIKVFACW